MIQGGKGMSQGRNDSVKCSVSVTLSEMIRTATTDELTDIQDGSGVLTSGSRPQPALPGQCRPCGRGTCPERFQARDHPGGGRLQDLHHR